VLAFLGILIAGAALGSSEADDKKFLPDNPQWFGWLCILGGPVLFIILGQYAGMMTILGLLVGIVGSEIETGQPRFTFGITELFDGVEIIALALGMFGIAEFMNSINNTETVDMKYAKVGISDMVMRSPRPPP
jgi:TctA family transporter